MATFPEVHYTGIDNVAMATLLEGNYTGIAKYDQSYHAVDTTIILSDY